MNNNNIGLLVVGGLLTYFVYHSNEQSKAHKVSKPQIKETHPIEPAHPPKQPKPKPAHKDPPIDVSKLPPPPPSYASVM